MVEFPVCSVRCVYAIIMQYKCIAVAGRSNSSTVKNLLEIVQTQSGWRGGGLRRQLRGASGRKVLTIGLKLEGGEGVPHRRVRPLHRLREPGCCA